MNREHLLPDTMTKKAFKEQARCDKYGHGRTNIAYGIFFDWKVGEGFGGFKYSMIAHNCTKAEAFDAAWDLFMWGHNPDELLVDVDCRIAKTDAERRKIPLTARLFND